MNEYHDQEIDLRDFFHYTQHIVKNKSITRADIIKLEELCNNNFITKSTHISKFSILPDSGSNYNIVLSNIRDFREAYNVKKEESNQLKQELMERYQVLLTEIKDSIKTLITIDKDIAIQLFIEFLNDNARDTIVDELNLNEFVDKYDNHISSKDKNFNFYGIKTNSYIVRMGFYELISLIHFVVENPILTFRNVYDFIIKMVIGKEYIETIFSRLDVLTKMIFAKKYGYGYKDLKNLYSFLDADRTALHNIIKELDIIKNKSNGIIT